MIRRLRLRDGNLILTEEKQGGLQLKTILQISTKGQADIPKKHIRIMGLCVN